MNGTLLLGTKNASTSLCHAFRVRELLKFFLSSATLVLRARERKGESCEKDESKENDKSQEEKKTGQKTKERRAQTRNVFLIFDQLKPGYLLMFL